MRFQSDFYVQKKMDICHQKKEASKLPSCGDGTGYLKSIMGKLISLMTLLLSEKNPIIGTMLKGEETMSYYIDAPFGDEKEFGTFSYCSMVDEDVRYFGGFLVFVPGRLDEGRLNTTAQQPFNVNLEKMEMTTPKLTW
mmetsp:Transcript_17207/g.20732  ORF Transcript_17207/g.20732 Transcript_17207/m.20732 type:complete len:138 (-) Transcript_17207:151-564(-)